MKKMCKHKLLKLGYIQAQELADKQICKGEMQTQCPTCGLWIWPCEWNKTVITTKKTRVVKGWAWMTLKGEIGAVTTLRCGSKIPCTIHIDEKWLKK